MCNACRQPQLAGSTNARLWASLPAGKVTAPTSSSPPNSLSLVWPQAASHAYLARRTSKWSASTACHQLQGAAPVHTDLLQSEDLTSICGYFLLARRMALRRPLP